MNTPASTGEDADNTAIFPLNWTTSISPLAHPSNKCRFETDRDSPGCGWKPDRGISHTQRNETLLVLQEARLVYTVAQPRGTSAHVKGMLD